jgi:hypothetical protein
LGWFDYRAAQTVACGAAWAAGSALQRLFPHVQHAGVLRTAEFALAAAGSGGNTWWVH